MVIYLQEGVCTLKCTQCTTVGFERASRDEMFGKRLFQRHLRETSGTSTGTTLTNSVFPIQR